MEKERPKIGVATILMRGDMVLLGKRKSPFGKGTWAFPGGHLEMGESIRDCAAREVMEETGIKIGNTRVVALTNDIYKDTGKHYITIVVIADAFSGVPEIMEPEKCEKWSWFEWDSLPEPLFLPLINLRKSGFDPMKC